MNPPVNVSWLLIQLSQPLKLVSFFIALAITYTVPTAIECPALTDPTKGGIVYASDTSAPYDFGTTATYSCNLGYSLVGDEVRTCGGDGSSMGAWDLSEPSCERMLATYNDSVNLQS